MNDGRLTVMEPRHGLACVAEDAEDLDLREPRAEPVIHQLEDIDLDTEGLIMTHYDIMT